MNSVSVHDLYATNLHQFEFRRRRLTDRDFRLTDVYGKGVKEILALSK